MSIRVAGRTTLAQAALGSQSLVTVFEAGRRTGKTEAIMAWAAEQIRTAKPDQHVEIECPTLRMGQMLYWDRFVRYPWPEQPTFRSKAKLTLMWKDGRVLEVVVADRRVCARAHDEFAWSMTRHLFMTTRRTDEAVLTCGTFPTTGVIDKAELKRIKRALAPEVYRREYLCEYPE